MMMTARPPASMLPPFEGTVTVDAAVPFTDGAPIRDTADGAARLVIGSGTGGTDAFTGFVDVDGMDVTDGARTRAATSCWLQEWHVDASGFTRSAQRGQNVRSVEVSPERCHCSTTATATASRSTSKITIDPVVTAFSDRASCIRSDASTDRTLAPSGNCWRRRGGRSAV